MKVQVIIPARYDSSRFPGKPLVMLKNKPLIQLTWECAIAAVHPDSVYVATDDVRIANCVRQFGGQVVMTSKNCRNGSERCAQALEKLGGCPDLVVNLQGDSPLTPHWFIDALIEAMGSDSKVQVATPVIRCEPQACEDLRAERREGRVGGTTVVFGHKNQALYFSKEVIPYQGPVFHHVGLYAYRPEALLDYCRLKPGVLEESEGLEQLRFLEHGYAIKCVEVETQGRFFWELNNPEDVAKIEAVL